MNVNEYLNGHSAVKIGIGQGGADVYEIDGKYVLKYANRKKLEAEQFDSYSREALFYRSMSARQRSYLPKVLKIEADENEIFILMKKYDRPQRNKINGELLQKITSALAELHTDEVPSFLYKKRENAEPLSDSRIAECLSGWKSVLKEHSGKFDESIAEETAAQINDIIKWHDSEDHVLVHGDFHWDNLLIDENANILICDWQGVNFGSASGDLSFFISRLCGDGIQPDTDVFLNFYVKEFLKLTGKQLDKQNILLHMNADNAVTTFVFWHEYLHNSSEERVRDIYSKMAFVKK